MLIRQLCCSSHLNQSLSWHLHYKFQPTQFPGSERLYRTRALAPARAKVPRTAPRVSLWLQLRRARLEFQALTLGSGRKIRYLRVKEKYAALVEAFSRTTERHAIRQHEPPITARRPSIFQQSVHKASLSSESRSATSHRWRGAILALNLHYGRGESKSTCQVQSSQDGRVEGIWFGKELLVSRRTWEGQMLCMLYTDPKEALKLLDVDLSSPNPLLSHYNVLDCLVVISHAFLKPGGTFAYTEDFDTNMMIRCFYNFLTKYWHGRIYSEKRRDYRFIIRLVSRCCVRNQLLKVFNIVQDRVHLSPSMKEGFVHRFVDNGDLFNALRVFRLIPRSFFLLNYTEQHVCVRILRLKLQVENLYATRSAILTEMLERGIRPNRFMVNVIMTNAVEGEDYNTVWKVHALTAGNGMKPDDITYDLLLRVARDMETVENIRKEASEAGIFPKVPRLVATYLVSVFKLAQAQDSDSMVFDLLLPTYREFFDILPLNDLLGLRLDQDEGARNWEVNHVALGIMILAYLRQTRHGRDTHQIYQNYMKLIQTGHPVWLELAKTDHTANAFVWALGQRADTLHLCISVLEDMIKYSASLGVMPPKEMTWSMLLNNFLYHGQISAAERVLSIMKARGVETQQMTWSNIVAAYARTQDVGAAVDALIRLEKNGFSIDERTIKALGLIHDRERLREALEAVSQKPSTDGNVSKLSSADDTSVYQAVGAV